MSWTYSRTREMFLVMTNILAVCHWNENIDREPTSLYNSNNLNAPETKYARKCTKNWHSLFEIIFGVNKLKVCMECNYVRCGLICANWSTTFITPCTYLLSNEYDVFINIIQFKMWMIINRPNTTRNTWH